MNAIVPLKNVAPLGAVAAILNSTSMARAADSPRPPNLVVILTDDQGYADVGFNGCKDIPTPHLDSIAAAGVRFTSGFVSYAPPTLRSRQRYRRCAQHRRVACR